MKKNIFTSLWRTLLIALCFSPLYSFSIKNTDEHSSVVEKLQNMLWTRHTRKKIPPFLVRYLFNKKNTFKDQVESLLTIIAINMQDDPEYHQYDVLKFDKEGSASVHEKFKKFLDENGQKSIDNVLTIDQLSKEMQECLQKSSTVGYIETNIRPDILSAWNVWYYMRNKFNQLMLPFFEAKLEKIGDELLTPVWHPKKPQGDSKNITAPLYLQLEDYEKFDNGGATENSIVKEARDTIYDIVTKAYDTKPKKYNIFDKINPIKLVNACPTSTVVLDAFGRKIEEKKNAACNNRGANNDQCKKLSEMFEQFNNERKKVNLKSNSPTSQS